MSLPIYDRSWARQSNAEGGVVPFYRDWHPMGYSLSRVTSQESCGFKVEIREKVHSTIFELMEAAATSVEDAPLDNPALTLHGNCIMLAVWRLLPSKREAIAPRLAAAITPEAQAASFLAKTMSGPFHISSTPAARNRFFPGGQPPRTASPCRIPPA